MRRNIANSLNLYLASRSSEDYRTHGHAVTVLSVKATQRIIQRSRISIIVCRI